MSADEIPEPFNSDLERRVLGNVPRWWPDDATVDVYAKYDDNGDPVGKAQQVGVEEHLRDANGYDEDWSLPSSITVDELLVRVDADQGAPLVTKDQLKDVLAALGEQGYINRAGNAVAMTEAGFNALTAGAEED